MRERERRRREQSVRRGPGELHGRFARVLHGLRRYRTASCATLDMGHFHPTEETYDKISSLLLFTPEIHAARKPSGTLGQRPRGYPERQRSYCWLRRSFGPTHLNKANIGLDYFDASINRIGAYVVGSRATQKAFLQALLTLRSATAARVRSRSGQLLPALGCARRGEESAVGGRVRLLLLRRTTLRLPKTTSRRSRSTRKEVTSKTLISQLLLTKLELSVHGEHVFSRKAPCADGSYKYY